jgi:hypothetical protein
MPTAPDRAGPAPRNVKMRVVARDPSVPGGSGSILTALVDVPAEVLAPGPRGYRVQVVDYDATTRKLYPPLDPAGEEPWIRDPARELDDEVVLGDPRFHARNAYALAMRTLARFEYALGRRVPWGFEGHQLKLAPHAFADANAFYSQRDEALLFGYFPRRDGKGQVFTGLAHEIVVHETSHAVLDGLRNRFQEPSSLDQAAFHEGFADVVALLSVFSQREVVAALVDRRLGEQAGPREVPPVLDRKAASPAALRASLLTGVGLQFGQELGAIGRDALRHSAGIEPDKAVLEERTEPHERGEVLVAAMLRAFLDAWVDRLERLLRDPATRWVDRTAAVEEGTRIADYLLTVAIRALDYTPTVHVDFPTWLSAMLTADREVRAVDDPALRAALVGSFAAYGIAPASVGAEGAWEGPDEAFDFDRTRFESMQRDPDEVFRFVWENRRRLSLHEGAYTRVLSVRPCHRPAPEDGFVLHETVAEVLQQVTLHAGELAAHGLRKPEGMPDGHEVMLLGGVTLIFDEYGKVKYAIGDRVLDPRRKDVQQRQSERIASLWERGFHAGKAAARRFSAIHRQRALGVPARPQEEW